MTATSILVAPRNSNSDSEIATFLKVYRFFKFRLVGFYGISTILGYLMPNPVKTHILNI